MIERIAQKALLRLASQFPVIGITGPRQSGKSTLAKLTFPQKKYVSLWCFISMVSICDTILYLKVNQTFGTPSMTPRTTLTRISRQFTQFIHVFVVSNSRVSFDFQKMKIRKFSRFRSNLLNKLNILLRLHRATRHSNRIR